MSQARSYLKPIRCRHPRLPGHQQHELRSADPGDQEPLKVHINRDYEHSEWVCRARWDRSPELQRLVEPPCPGLGVLGCFSWSSAAMRLKSVGPMAPLDQA